MTTVNQIKTLLEIQALQSFTNPSSTQSSDTNSLFQQLLTSALESSINGKTESSTTNLYSTLNQTLPVNIHFPTNQKPINAPKDLDSIIQKASEKYNIPKELIKSVIQHESSFNANAVSKSGASGLMQLMPSTAKSLGVTNVFDPEQNIFAGSKYLKNMLDRYDGDINLALAAYNAGPGNVDRFGGIPPFKETQNYVKNITNSFYS
ncbi:lytic transglycosylase domain-containing protein [Heyndrickxia sporothermodurans]|uniref:Lytic transglycosylase domain-containing protein n=1 Tax=Heyndrickxia sporothermodurans TaxID=46224 RepID=A0AB37H4J2_9BACI|nr:lytic transglycosylase domain-containing protein [Heyndrickxia sporothermodurans]MBL5766802.1 lytic transglycosylase domain-containing protein [Heyndrickxia sporothermodurans]MBL5771513.1 lytic transglycosylase domain-containing protein [Heyndrickxia sporothermodurans]MBL5774113.1 lytic transglycosylase domain-containing protein [Heyndrickxia sporothermodurans]MBL5781038.1 lytic transglycosylase domain-containing protein [Heyndrickxia sporothermodurans]MBL5784653.1 lytic transglycosylase do